MMESESTIHNRALLVWLNIRTWSARKYDRGLTQKVNAQYASTSDAGRYNKLLIPGDAASYKRLVALAGSIRTEHYVKTLSWSDEGWRLLPTANWMDYADWFRHKQYEWTEALDAFVFDYPQAKAQAKTLLNGLYEEGDYPDVQDIRQRFSIALDYAPVAAQGDIRVNLAAEQVEAICRVVAERHDAKLSTAMKDAWERLYTVTKRIQEKLADPDAVFRDSLVENARIVVDALRGLNVMDDTRLEELRAEVEQKLTTHDANTLRDSIQTRHSTAVAAEDILKRMAEYGFVR